MLRYFHGIGGYTQNLQRNRHFVENQARKCRQFAQNSQKQQSEGYLPCIRVHPIRPLQGHQTLQTGCNPR